LIQELLKSCIGNGNSEEIQAKILKDAPFYGRFINKTDVRFLIIQGFLLLMSSSGTVLSKPPLPLHNAMLG
jgi:hypothetical protein